MNNNTVMDPTDQKDDDVLSKLIRERIKKMTPHVEEIKRKEYTNYVNRQLSLENDFQDALRFSGFCAFMSDDDDKVKSFYRTLIRKMLRLYGIKGRAELEIVEYQSDTLSGKIRWFKDLRIHVWTMIYEEFKGKKFYQNNSHYHLRYPIADRDGLEGEWKPFFDLAHYANPSESVGSVINQAITIADYRSECNDIIIGKVGQLLTELDDGWNFFQGLSQEDTQSEVFYETFSDYEINEDLDFVTTDGAVRAYLKKIE